MEMFTFRGQISGKKNMQKTDSAAMPWHVPCSKCGKPTFSDLLDKEGMCDYCREVRSMKTAVVKKKKEQSGRK